MHFDSTELAARSAWLTHALIQFGHDYASMLPFKLVDYTIFTIIASTLVGWRVQRSRKALALKLATTHRYYISRIEVMVEALGAGNVPEYRSARTNLDKALAKLEERRGNLARYLSDADLQQLLNYSAVAKALRTALWFQIAPEMEDKEQGKFRYSALTILSQQDRFCSLFAADEAPTLQLAQEMREILKTARVYFFRRSKSDMKRANAIDSKARQVAEAIVRETKTPAAPSTIKAIANSDDVESFKRHNLEDFATIRSEELVARDS